MYADCYYTCCDSAFVYELIVGHVVITLAAKVRLYLKKNKKKKKKKKKDFKKLYIETKKQIASL